MDSKLTPATQPVVLFQPVPALLHDPEDFHLPDIVLYAYADLGVDPVVRPLLRAQVLARPTPE